MTVGVVKLGGDVLEDPARGTIADSLRTYLDGGQARLAIVHGGGAQVTDLCRRLGVDARVIAGRRVTDAATLDVLKMALAGRLNVDLCAALQARGVPAVGLHAGSGVIRARRRPPRALAGAGPDAIDLGLVGDVVSFDVPVLEALWLAGRVPVLSCLGLEAATDGKATGTILNLNADLVAAQLAATLAAGRLIAVTAVGGVLRDKADPLSRIVRMTAAEAKAAIAAGLVAGGMIAKLEEAQEGIAAGLRHVQIVAPTDLAAALHDPTSAGTLLEP